MFNFIDLTLFLSVIILCKVLVFCLFIRANICSVNVLYAFKKYSFHSCLESCSTVLIKSSNLIVLSIFCILTEFCCMSSNSCWKRNIKIFNYVCVFICYLFSFCCFLLHIFWDIIITIYDSTLCDLMNCSPPGFAVHHYLLDFAQIHLSRWCHPTISPSVTPFSSCPQSFPASGSFPMSQLFASGGQGIGTSASASVVPVNIEGWFPLELTVLISLLSKDNYISGVIVSGSWCPDPWLLLNVPFYLW